MARAIPLNPTYTGETIRFSKGVLYIEGWNYSGDTPTPPTLGTLTNVGLIQEVTIKPADFDVIKEGGMPFDGPIVVQSRGGNFEITGTIGSVSLKAIAYAMGAKLDDLSDGGSPAKYKLDPGLLARFATLQVVFIPHEVSNSQIADSGTTPVAGCDVFSFRKVMIDPTAFELAMKYERERELVPFKAVSMQFLEDESDPHHGLHGLIVPNQSLDLTIDSHGWNPGS